ncbi:MAG: HD domain-containing protein [Candidatus Omnitrophica bacterium]|nr:HD domain-containing protein [Candidatus Omnitrophota bacterium]
MASGVIDIGSNSIKLLIGEPSDGDIMIIESLKNVVPIGRATFLKGSISQELINLTINTLEKYKKILREYNVNQVFVIGTTAVREADNRNIFVDTVRRKTGLEIDVLNVGDIVYYIDAYISHKLKGTYPVHNKNLLIAEMGAGSLDISILKKGFTLMNTGLALGALRFKQLTGKIDGSKEELAEAVHEYIENEFRYLKTRLPRLHVDDIFLIDENQDLLKAILPSKKVSTNFFQFSVNEVDKVITELTEKTNEEVAHDYDLPVENTEALLPYMVVLKMFFELTGIPHVYILETSLAEAVLANKVLGLELSRRYNKSNQLLSVAHSICEQYNVNIDHSKHVAHLAKVLFEGLGAQLGLEERDLLYLSLAAYLHDIGKFISNRAHHKHSEYIISSLNLFRLTDEEIKTIACVARYHRRGDPQRSHLVYNSLSDDRQIAVQKLSALLRIANALDHAHRQKVQELKVLNGTSDDVTLQVDSRDNFLLEKNDFLEKKELFERITGSRIRLVINESF